MNKEQALIEQIKKNGAQELEPIYLKYRNEFIHWAIKNFRCTEEESKDVFQNSMLTFYENVINNKLKVLTSSIKTYIFSIGRNKLLESSRVANKYVNVPVEATESFEVNQNKVLKEKQFEIMENCLSRLGHPCKEILQLYYYQKSSMEDISKKLGYKNTDTAKNQKYKCLQRLRHMVKEQRIDVVP